MKNFGISGIWKNPRTTVPGVVAGCVGIAVAFGWIDKEESTAIIAAVTSLVLALIGLFYKGQEPCPPLEEDKTEN
jgi:fumarate reductase subunit D